MNPTRIVPLVAATLLTVAALWAALPVGATHSATFDGSLPSTASNHVYQNLTVTKVTSGNLTNAAVSTWFKVNASSSLHIRKSNVGSSLTLKAVTSSEYSESNVTGPTFVNGSSNVFFSKMRFLGEVRILDSTHVRFDQSTFAKCVAVERSTNVTFTGGTSVPPACPTPSPSPTTSRPPTSSPTVVTDCYANGQFVPCPTKTTSPTPTKTATNPYESYVYELVGQTYSRDVYVRGADRVTIRDSTIVGNVFIGSSANVVLEHVEVSGDVHIDQSTGVAFLDPHVGGTLGLSGVNDFKVLGGPTGPGTIGGVLGCYRCTNGLFQSLRAGGAVEIKESTNVGRIDVVGQTQVDYVPPPAASPEPGKLVLNVSNDSLTFTHDTDIQGVDRGVRLEMSPFEARARLQLAPETPNAPQLDLESRFEKIVEFEDRNGDGAYDLSDLVLHEYLIDDLKVSVQQERLGEGQDGWRGRLDYELPPGGTFSLIFTARDADPDNTKIDIAFEDYPYATSSSQLALQVRLASASAWDIRQQANEDRLLFHGRGVDGFFGWVHNVLADDQDQTVTARVLEEHRSQAGEREVVLYLAYPQARSILHDPSIGLEEAIGISVPQLGNLVVYGTTLVAILAVLWALGQSSRRKPS